MIYLDNSMTTRPSERVISEMFPFLTERWGIPSSPHAFGQETHQAIERSYRALYRLIGAKEEDTVIFTSSGAEAVNHVFLSTYQDITVPTGKNQYITAATEDAPAMMSINRLEQFGCSGKMVSLTNKGEVTVEAVADTISPRTALVSLSWASGLTGVIHPVAEIADLCRERGIIFHLDATHVLGKLYFELDDIAPDFISFNGDHLHAPKGSGALYIKQGVKSSPFIIGGLEQGGHRAGNLDVASLVALGCAAEEVLESRDYMCTEIARLRNRLEKEINHSEVLFPGGLPHIACIGFPGIVNEALLYLLSRKGVYASIGGGSAQQIGHILTAAGVDEALQQGGISFSLSRYTTEEEIEQTITIVNEIVSNLLKTSQGIVS